MGSLRPCLFGAVNNPCVLCPLHSLNVGHPLISLSWFSLPVACVSSSVAQTLGLELLPCPRVPGCCDHAFVISFLCCWPQSVPVSSICDNLSFICLINLLLMLSSVFLILLSFSFLSLTFFSRSRCLSQFLTHAVGHLFCVIDFLIYTLS